MSLPPNDENKTLAPREREIAPEDAVELLTTSTEIEFLSSLSMAHHPEELSEERNLALIEQVLGIPLSNDEKESEDAAKLIDSAPSEGELRSARELAEALDGNGTHPLAQFSELLRVATTPSDPSPLGLKRAERALNLVPLEATRGKRIAKSSVIIGVTCALTLAASFALLVTRPPDLSRTAEPSQVALSRSLSPLFAEPQAPSSATERMDRIVMIRSRELRQNRYLAWRVR